MTIDGFDNGALEHFLSFDSDNTGLVEILEPINFTGANFKMQQETGRYGRDVTFAGGEAEFTFSSQVKLRGLTHEFDRIMRYNRTYGFESDVKYVLRYNGEDYVLGELDFEQAETDGLKYFTCKVIQDSLEATIKRNKGITVNLLSDTDINGQDITPLVPDTILVKATPLEQASEWSAVDTNNTLTSGDGDDTTRVVGFSPVLLRTEINNSFSPFYGVSSDNSTREDCRYITADSNLTNLTFSITELSYELLNPINASFRLIYRVGQDFSTASEFEVNIPTTDNNASYEFTIEQLNRDESLWCYIFINNSPASVFLRVTSAKVSLKAVSLSLDSVTNQFRLIDAMRQVVKSISGATINAPQFEEGGLLHDQHIILGNYLRDIDIQKFELTFDDLLEGLKEFDADYEVQRDGTIYFGLRDSFYPNNNLGSFTQLPSATFMSSYNPRFIINQLDWKYGTYEEGQNESIENSKQGTHTEAQFKMPNVRAENVKDINCPWIRDPFKIESIRRQGLTVRDTAAQENDDSIAIVQGITLQNQNRPRIERFRSNHIINGGTVLEIVNDGGFNWSISGIQVNDTVTIDGENAGSYVVGSFGQSSIQLIPFAPTPNPTFQGVTFTTINYSITSTNLVVATDENFTEVLNVADPSRFANIAFTIKRNIVRFYGTYLKTACNFYPLGSITNTSFKFNGDFSSRESAFFLRVIENDNISVETLPNAVLSTRLTTTDVPCSFTRFWDLLLRIRSEKGFIEITNNNGELVRTYPQELEYSWTSQVLTIKGENRVNF